MFRTESKNIFSITFFFRKSCRLWDNVEKHSRSGEAIDDNMAHVHFTVDTEWYRHILRICNTYCFSIITMVAWARLSVTLYVYCLAVPCPFVCGIQCKSSQNSATDLRLVRVTTSCLYCRRDMAGLSNDDRFWESGRTVFQICCCIVYFMLDGYGLEWNW